MIPSPSNAMHLYACLPTYLPTYLPARPPSHLDTRVPAGDLDSLGRQLAQAKQCVAMHMFPQHNPQGGGGGGGTIASSAAAAQPEVLPAAAVAAAAEPTSAAQLLSHADAPGVAVAGGGSSRSPRAGSSSLAEGGGSSRSPRTGSGSRLAEGANGRSASNGLAAGGSSGGVSSLPVSVCVCVWGGGALGFIGFK